MKTLRVQTKTAQKRSAAGVDDAIKMAFKELCKRASGEVKAARDRRRAEKDKQWEGTAKKFKGLSEALRLQIESRNISAGDEGYRVAFMRGGENFARQFYGVSEESLSAAIKFRDEALKILGENRTNVPPRVLKTLGLSDPVPGIARDASKSVYTVARTGAKKTRKQQRFSYRFLAEEDAYAAAIACVEASLKAK